MELVAQTGGPVPEVVRMVATYDRLTDELQRSCIRLNDELVFTPQRYGEKTCFHIEVPSRSKFFRVGYHEYVFISLLDGKTTFAHALAVTAQQSGDEALSEAEARKTISWMLENGLAAFADKRDSIDVISPDKANSTILQKINPFWIKIPLGNPDGWFRTIEPYFQWLFHPVSILVSIGFMFASLMTALSSWEYIAAGCQGILAADNWFWILLTWVFLKVIHECAHGLACRIHGGEIRETGLIFILFAPMAYVDVTSSWSISSRWKRISIAAAGMYIELLVAAVAVFLLFLTQSQIQKQLLINVIVMASLTTIAFNANPLMRFDGYFILSDLMKIPNLYTVGSKAFSNMMQWIFYGQKSADSSYEIQNHRLFVTAYGFLAAAWKMLICIGLSISCSVMFGGLGIILALLGTLSWFAKPLFGLFRRLLQLSRQKPHSVVRCGLISSCLLALMVFAWCVVPNPFAARCPCLVDFKDEAKVRSRTSGFVAQIFVEDGQYVTHGTPLLRLENRDLESKVAALRNELESQSTQERIAMDKQQPGDAQIAAFNGISARKRLDEKLSEQQSLTVHAPVDGYVVARTLKQLQGMYFRQGETIMTIGDPASKEIVLSIAPDDVRSTIGLIGQQVPVEIGSRRKINAWIKRVDPRAGVQIRRPALAVPYGGPLPVKPVEQNGESDYELIDSRFHAIATIDRTVSERLFAGERGFALLDSNANTLGKWIYQSTYRWLQTQIETASQATSF